MAYNRVAILGTGLIGSSIGLALKAARPQTQVIGYDASGDNLRRAQSVKAIVVVRDGHEVSADELIAHCKERIASYKKPRTVEEDQRNLRLHILPAFGTRKITDIDKADIDKWHSRRKDAPVNANRCLAVMSHMFTMAEDWNLRPANSNPCRRVKKYVENRREIFLSGRELERRP